MRPSAWFLVLSLLACRGEAEQRAGESGNEATPPPLLDIPAESLPQQLPAPIPIPTDEAREFYVERVTEGVYWAEDAALLELGFELLEANVPSVVEGNGRRLGEIPTDSLAARLGFASRDLVLEVNGQSPVEAKGLRSATRIAVDDGRFVVKLRRNDEPLTLEIHVLRQRRPLSRDYEFQALAVLRGGVRILGDVRRLIDRKVIEAFADHPSLHSPRVFDYLAIPEGADVESVGGLGIEDQGSPTTTLSGVGEEVNTFEVSIRTADGSLVVLQYEISEGLVNEEDLGRVLAALPSRVPSRSEPETATSLAPVALRIIEGAEEAITCESDTKCTVDRKFWDKLVKNPAQIAMQARIVPSQRDGVTQGFKVYGIRRGTLPKLFGLKNGDMLKKVNGKSLDSVSKAIDAFETAKRGKTLEVTIERKGAEMKKTIVFK